MTRTDDDNWDLRTGVGATATMTAAARAVASRSPDRLINDPLAADLVRAVGLQLFAKIVDGRVDFAEIGARWVPTLFGIRSRAINDLVADACRAGIRQAVILASGLDCRAFYPDWPPGMTIYEIDQPRVLAWKDGVLARLGRRASVRLHYVGVDLRRDWSTALLRKGFAADAPTVWIVEGLLIGYLPPAAQEQLLDAICALSARGSRITGDYFDVRRPDVVSELLNGLHDLWCKRDADLNLRSLTFSGLHRDPTVYLAEHGWTTSNSDLAALFRSVGWAAAPEFPSGLKFMRLLSGTFTGPVRPVTS